MFEDGEMDNFENELTSNQTETLIQFQEVTGIDDISICRDNLQRHQWDIEAAIQAHMNICEGRPSLYAMETRPPPVINDLVAQRVIFPSATHADRNSNGFLSFFQNLFQSVYSFTYTSLFSILQFTLRMLGYQRQPELTDPLRDVMTFIQNFEERFGPDHPVFYQGTYSQVLNDAKRELRFLYVYLHDDSNTDAVTFCRDVLTTVEVINFFNNHNTLLWACSINSGEGYRVSQTFNTRRYPFVAVILLRNGKMTIIGKICGLTEPQAFVTSINQFHQENEWHLARARSERVERNLTQTLREQQDQAYIESLRADEEKQRQREEKKAKLRAEELRQQSEAKAEQNRRISIEILKQQTVQNLPPEPSANDLNSVHIVFKLPNGSRISRRFYNSDSLQVLYNFVFSHKEAPNNFEITTNYPKKVLRCRLNHYSESDMDEPCLTIQEANLVNREVLFVNDLDS